MKLNHNVNKQPKRQKGKTNVLCQGMYVLPCLSRADVDKKLTIYLVLNCTILT